MNWIGWVVIAVVVSLGQAGLAQAGCWGWNTFDFFEDADGDLVRTCLDAGADPNARNEDGDTPLHIAAWNGQTEAIAALLDAGADPNARNEDGDTPLHIAAWNGQTEAIAALLDAGADPNARNEDGDTPLHIAAWNGQTEAIAALIDAGADPNARAENGEIPFDLISEDSPLVGTSAYWRLRDARID